MSDKALNENYTESFCGREYGSEHSPGTHYIPKFEINALPGDIHI